jgi:CDP-diacylglycerol---glycerol-3-phosphate 3-phosphatidyltransferase
MTTQIPNLLTILRIVSVPVLIYLLFGDDAMDPVNRIITAVIFVLAFLTDIADGAIARAYQIESDFGKIADPIADKALIGVGLFALAYHELIPAWIFFVIITREIFITILRFWVIKKGIIPASKGGKLKTIVQIVAITAFLLPLPDLIAFIAPVSMALAVALTIVTGIDYVVKAVVLSREKSN